MRAERRLVGGGLEVVLVGFQRCVCKWTCFAEPMGKVGLVWGCMSDGLALDECLRWPFVRGLRCELWAAVTPVSVGAVQLNSTQFRLVDSYVFMLELHTVQCIMIVADFWFDEDRTDV